MSTIIFFTKSVTSQTHLAFAAAVYNYYIRSLHVSAFPPPYCELLKNLPPGPVVGDLLEEISAIFKCCLNPDKDPEMRLKFFALLSRLVLSSATTINSKNHFGEFAQSFVRDIILPNCVWRAGRTAGAIRTTAVSCLWALLQSGVLTKERVSHFFCF